MQIPPVFHGIIDCPKSGFIFFKENFTPDELTRLRPLVESAAYQAMRDEAVAYRALWLRQRFEPLSARETHSLLLDALWEAWNRAELYRKYATELLPLLLEERGKRLSAGGTTDVRADRLIGELLRRLGRFEEARNHFQAMSPKTQADKAFISAELKLLDARDSNSYRYSEFPDLKPWIL